MKLEEENEKICRPVKAAHNQELTPTTKKKKKDQCSLAGR